MTAPVIERPVAPAPDLGGRRPRRRWLRFALVVLVVALAVWMVWFSSVFAAAQVRVLGVEGARADAALTAAAVPVGVPLARVDTARAERAVRGLPWVLDAEVRRGWPSEIVVAVTARVPIATVTAPDGTGRLGVDAEGVTFPVAGALPKGLPTVTADGVGLTASMAALATLPPDLARKVVSVSATTRDDIELTLRSGDVVRWGSADQPELKAEVLRALMDRKADIYDVAAPEVPTTFRSR